MTATIREGTLDDLETVVGFNLALARESEGRELDEQVLRAGVKALLGDSEKGTYFLAELDGKVIAQTMITCEWSDWRNGNFWWIQSVYVDAAHRGTGVFSLLYRYIHKRALASEGVSGLRLYVDQDNQPAADIYRALGMQDAHYDMLEVDFTARPPV